MNIFVIGHQNPDLDSAVAALSIARLMELRGETNVIPLLSGKPNPETILIFEKFNVPLPRIISSGMINSDDKVVLVDHNEDQHISPLINKSQIIAIFDHHSPNITHTNPIEINIMPIGSVNTLSFLLLKQKDTPLGKDLASLMLCAILSDTLGLKSSTTTQTDHKAVSDLSILANIDNTEKLLEEIYQAKSDISSLSDEEVIKNDYKIFDFNSKKVLISKIETTNSQAIISTRQEPLRSTLQLIKEEFQCDYAYLAIINISQKNTQLVSSSEAEEGIVEKAFQTSSINYIADIGKRLSCKNDIAPYIESVILKTNH